jgi:hypothetical protein
MVNQRIDEPARRTNDQGQVAVLISHGYGAGWYTWHGIYELLWDPTVVDMVLNQRPNEEIVDYCSRVYGEQYWGGVDGLAVHWLDPGTEFRIDEYDGSEHYVLKTSESWLTA